MRDLVTQWREDAARLAKWGASAQAEVLERCASDLEVWEREHALEALTLEEAVAESGYTYSAIEKAVRHGRLANVGTKGRPRVRRADLPKKGGTVGPGLADAILAARA